MINCNLCNSRENKQLYIKNGFEIAKCKNCELVFVKNQPNVDILENKYYTKKYYQGQIYKDYLGESEKRINHFKKRIKVIDTIYPKKGKILDVGCAAGFFLEVANDDGWDTVGVELSEYSYNYTKNRGLKIFHGDFCYLDDLDTNYTNYFDVITFWDSIEHLKNPTKALLRANKYLKSGGLLVISTGNIDSIAARISGIKWYLLEPPYHLYYFSQKTITKLLKKTGFKILKINKSYGNVINLDLFENIINNKVFSVFITYMNYLLLKLNFGDIMTVYATKM